MKITENIFPIEWNLTDPIVVPYHGKKVFGTFVCGGGSSMGYKLAGFNHLGGVEFLDKYADTYETNLHPKYMYRADIRDFVERHDLPEELYHLDMLDGSPPCAAFSTAGKREKLWGKKSKYEDKEQQKDDLPFVYVKLILKLKPKVFLLENVSGLAKGNAKTYLKRIVNQLSSEYDTQVFLLNAASMGCPQLRPRCFVIGHRKEYHLPKLELDFDCPVVPFRVTEKYWNHPTNEQFSIENVTIGNNWEETKIGGKHEKHFSLSRPNPDLPCPTCTASDAFLAMNGLCHPYQKRRLNNEETRMLCTFPKDYQFVSGTEPKNVMGRSVLPVMMANISHQIYEQWLKLI